MANVLTSTGSRTTYYYLALIILFILVVGFLWFFKQPSIKQNLDEGAFYSSYLAFQNSIRLANRKYLANINDGKYLDKWIVNGKGLDYNKTGFPIGTSVVIPELAKPQTAIHCQQIWQFLMGPLQPELVLDKNLKHYWVILDSQSNCVFKNPRVLGRHIVYEATSGEVSFSEITN